MRKLKLQMQMTVNGFTSGPNGEMDWMNWQWDDQLNGYVQALTDSVDTIVLPGDFAQGFIPWWAEIAEDPQHEEYASAVQFTEMHKVVFSEAFDLPTGTNTEFFTGELAEGIKQLKQQEGKDLIAYGGEVFVASLIKQELIDEFYLFINPTAIPHGQSIFHELETYQPLILKESLAFPCGIVLLHYTLKE